MQALALRNIVMFLSADAFFVCQGAVSGGKPGGTQDSFLFSL